MNSVLYIFKILIKVPCYIFVSYLIFNVFAFAYSYLQMVSLFYTVSSVVMENNYIPPRELGMIREQMERMETSILSNIRLTPRTPDAIRDREQYGEELTVGVVADYTWIFPFMPHLQHGAVEGIGNYDGLLQGGEHGDYKNFDFESYNDRLNRNTEIEIEQFVPAMKYYADLEF